MNKTILLVDYEQKSLEGIRQFFRDDSFTLLTASDGSEALEIFESRSPDLVLTSALLPRLNGFELCKKITSGQHGEVRPVIMFSGIYKAEKYRKEAIIGCGAVDFLEKPLVKEQLLKQIKSLLSEIPYISPASQAPMQVGSATAELSASSSPTIAASQAVALVDDLLNVDTLFEGDLALRSQESSAVEQELTILDVDMPLTRPPLIASEEEREIEAALDAYRIDLDLETKLRDERIAQELEAEWANSGQNILEFEPPLELEAESPPITVNQEAEIIELDVVVTNIDAKQEIPQSQGLAPITGNTSDPEASNVAVPSFGMNSQETRNWARWITLIMVGLLMFLLFWLRSR